MILSTRTGRRRADSRSLVRVVVARMFGAGALDIHNVAHMLLRYRYRLYPDAVQRDALARAFGCARVVYNDGLRLRQEAFAAGQGFIDDGELYLAKVGDVEVVWSRRLPAEPSSVTVVRDAAHRYWASFVVEVAEQPLPRTDVECGIDLGLTHFGVTSAGDKIASPRFLRRAQRKLKRLHRELSRKQKGSANRQKARLKLARQHAKVADRRRNWHHQESTRIIRENLLALQRSRRAHTAPYPRMGLPVVRNAS